MRPLCAILGLSTGGKIVRPAHSKGQYATMNRYSKIIASIVALALAFVAPLAANAASNTSAIVMIVTTEGGHTYAGAGVIVAAKANTLTVWTARHVTEGKITRLAFVDGAEIGGRSATIATPLANEDFAIVTVAVPNGFAEKQTVAAIRTTDSLPDIGGAVTVIGHPHGEGWTQYDAQVAFKTTDQGPIPGVVLSCNRCAVGDSGGGVFDNEGNLIGILTGIGKVYNADGQKPGDYTMIVPVPEIRAALIAKATASR